MATRRQAVPGASIPEARLFTQDIDTWVTAAEQAQMRELVAAMRAGCDSPDYAAHADPQRAAHNMFRGSWGFNGPIEGLLLLWADDRRGEACQEWKRANPGSKIEDFGTMEPFEDGFRWL